MKTVSSKNQEQKKKPVESSESSLSFNDNYVRELYLIFQGSTSYPLHRFVKPGFQHVYAIERQPLAWVCHDPNLNDLINMVLPASYDMDVMQTFMELNSGCTIVQLFVSKNPRNGYLRWGWINCTGVIQYMLGIHRPWLVTPYQLFKKLLKDDVSHIKLGTVIKT